MQVISRPVLQYTKDGKFVAEFESIRSAANSVGTSAGNVYCCCSPDYYAKTVKGYIFKFKEDASEHNDKVLKVINQKYENEVMGGM